MTELVIARRVAGKQILALRNHKKLEDLEIVVIYANSTLRRVKPVRVEV